MKIIERIFQLMDMKNIRPIDLANELNISKGVISNWKRRNTNPPAEYIKPLADFLGVSTDFLLTGEESENSKSISHTSTELLNDIEVSMDSFNEKNIPLNLKYFMNTKKLKQVDLSNLTGLSKNAISNYLSGNRVPDTQSLYKISTALNVSIDSILSEKNTTNENNSKRDSELYILNMYRELNEKNQNKIEGMLELLCSDPNNKKQSDIVSVLKVAEKSVPYKTEACIPQPESTKVYIPMLGYIAAGQPIALPDDYTFDDVVAMPCTKEAAQADFALQIKGDSMSPLIEDGDTILVKRQNTADNGQIVVVSINNATTLKKFYQFPDRVELHAINIKYDPIIINNEYTDFKILGIKL